MEWYYAAGEERKGPLSNPEFERLVQSGVITSQTLVWRDGMPSWLPYASASAPPVPSAPPPADGVMCEGCRQIFARSEVIPLANGMYCAACKPVALQKLREGVTSNTEAEQTRNQHLKHEASVQSVGVLYWLGGVALVVLGVASAFGDGGAVGFGIGLLLFLFGVGQLLVGTGLRKLKPWARIPTAIFSGIGLLGFPVGTLINGYILYLVLSKKGKTVFSDEYKTVIQQTPHIKYKTSIVVWIVLGLLVLLIGIGLIAAFIGARSRGR